MTFLADWYPKKFNGVGFFQIGGGIMEISQFVWFQYQDMEMPETPFLSYFCQISDSTTSYGSYSELNEKLLGVN
jgi:deoxyhypusine synthase